MAKKHKKLKSPNTHPQYCMGRLTDAPVPSDQSAAEADAVTSAQSEDAAEMVNPSHGRPDYVGGQNPLNMSPSDMSPSDLALFGGAEPDQLSGKILDEQQQILIRGIAHDINNNLMAILSACDEIESRSSNSGDLDWAFNSIRMYVKSSAVLMRDLVNSHSSEMSEVMDQDQLQSFLKSIMPSLTLLAGSGTSIELGAVITPPVRIHRMFLHRVLKQLIRNVSELEVERPLAFISVRRVHQWCEISIADNGPGF